MIEKLYKWQKTFLVILAILTALANLSLSKRLFAFLVDAIFGVAINILLFVVIFTIGNWTYGKFKKEEIIVDKVQEKKTQLVNKKSKKDIYEDDKKENTVLVLFVILLIIFFAIIS